MNEVRIVAVPCSETLSNSIPFAKAFLSWLRLSIYMAIVSVAIVISFHLKTQPSDLGEFCDSSQEKCELTCR